MWNFANADALRVRAITEDFVAVWDISVAARDRSSKGISLQPHE